jgi:hypothetical protein
MGALDHLDDAVAATIRQVLGGRAPELLRALEESDAPSMAVREQVNDVLADEVAREISAPDWEPTPHGALVEDAVASFLVVYPITEQVRGTDEWPPDPDLRGPERAGR